MSDAPVYRDEQQAVIRALNPPMGPKAASWQGQYQAGFVESESSRPIPCAQLGRERVDQECSARARIHANLAEPQWYALLARYSSDKKEQVRAVEFLAPFLKGAAGPRLREQIVILWAMPYYGGDDKRDEKGRFKPELFDIDGTGETKEVIVSRAKVLRRQLNILHDTALDIVAQVFKETGLMEVE